MRINEFLTQLFIKFAPVSNETVANLNVQLSSYISNILSKVEEKNQKNDLLTDKANQVKKEIENAPAGSKERDEAIFRFTELQDEFDKPTLVEKVVCFLEKPLVRVVLLVSFAFVARFLAKKLTSPATPEKEDLEEEIQPQYANFKGQQQFNGYPPPYPQYYGYGYPPQPQYHQGKHN